jgi:hypothetical protein
MNDIDRRCDAYLAWLDDKKRSQGPILNQISDTGNAVHSIMSITGSGPQALEIVSTAFGLLRSSLVNYHSRLLLEVESSTVNTIVLTKRNDFRDDIRTKAISSKPEAVYAIRAYLRICLPFTIETDINDLSSLQARGQDADQVPSVTSSTEVLPDQPAAPPRYEPPPRATERVRPTAPLPREEGPPGAETSFEMQLRPSDVRVVQAALCITQDGALGPETRRAIKLYESVAMFEPIDGKLESREGGQLLSKGACDTGSFRNYLERDRLAAAESVQRLKRRINSLLPTTATQLAVDANLNTTDTRMAVAEIKRLCAIANQFDLPDDEVTPEFLRRVGFSKKDTDPVKSCEDETIPQ